MRPSGNGSSSSRGQLEATGISPARAGSIALVALAGMEGALILCRAEGSAGPLDTVASELMRLITDATSGGA